MASHATGDGGIPPARRNKARTKKDYDAWRGLRYPQLHSERFARPKGQAGVGRDASFYAAGGCRC